MLRGKFNSESDYFSNFSYAGFALPMCYLITASFFEGGSMPTTTKSQNLLGCDHWVLKVAFFRKYDAFAKSPESKK